MSCCLRLLKLPKPITAIDQMYDSQHCLSHAMQPIVNSSLCVWVDTGKVNTDSQIANIQYTRYCQCQLLTTNVTCSPVT